MDTSVTVDDLLSQQVAAAQIVTQLAQTAADVHVRQAAAYRQAIAQGDRVAATKARNTMWEAIAALHSQLYRLDDIWNELAPRMLDESAR